MPNSANLGIYIQMVEKTFSFKGIIKSCRDSLDAARPWTDVILP